MGSIYHLCDFSKIEIIQYMYRNARFVLRKPWGRNIFEGVSSINRSDLQWLKEPAYLAIAVPH